MKLYIRATETRSNFWNKQPSMSVNRRVHEQPTLYMSGQSHQVIGPVRWDGPNNCPVDVLKQIAALNRAAIKQADLVIFFDINIYPETVRNEADTRDIVAYDSNDVIAMNDFCMALGAEKNIVLVNSHSLQTVWGGSIVDNNIAIGSTDSFSFMDMLSDALVAAAAKFKLQRRSANRWKSVLSKYSSTCVICEKKIETNTSIMWRRLDAPGKNKAEVCHKDCFIFGLGRESSESMLKDEVWDILKEENADLKRRLEALNGSSE